MAFQAGTHAALAAELTETLDEMAADGTTRAIVERYGLDADRMLEGPNGAE